MNIIAIIGLIFQAIKFLPDLVKIIKAILDLIRSLKGHPEFNSKEFLGRLHAAIQLAREKKDTSGLEALHKELLTACAADGACWLQSLRKQEGLDGAGGPA